MCIDYDSHKWGFYFIKNFDVFIIPVATGSLLRHPKLNHPRLKIKFYIPWNSNWLKKYMPNCMPYVTVKLYLSFLFHNNNSVTINKFKKWITISYSTLALNFKNWPFGVIVTHHFRPKSGHLNDRLYCKSINRTLKMLFIEGSGRFLRQTIPNLRTLLVIG